MRRAPLIVNPRRRRSQRCRILVAVR